MIGTEYENVEHAKKPWQFQTTVLSVPWSQEAEPGDGRQFEKDDFSTDQWMNRQVTPHL